MPEDHQHNFQIEIKHTFDGVQVTNPTKCKECDQLLHAEYRNGNWMLTLIPQQEQSIVYAVDVVLTNED